MSSKGERRTPTTTELPRDAMAVQIHRLGNTLASLRLRVGILAADPTCRWAQEENIQALLRIADEASEQGRALRALNTTQNETPAPRRRRAPP